LLFFIFCIIIDVTYMLADSMVRDAVYNKDRDLLNGKGISCRIHFINISLYSHLTSSFLFDTLHLEVVSTLGCLVVRDLKEV
jgi:hypothetical protein